MTRSVLGVALALVAFAAPARAAEPFQMMPADQVEKLLGTPGVYVFDANSDARYAQGHVPGATHVSKKTLRESLPADLNATLIFYCTNPR